MYSVIITLMMIYADNMPWSWTKTFPWELVVTSNWFYWEYNDLYWTVIWIKAKFEDILRATENIRMR